MASKKSRNIFNFEKTCGRERVYSKKIKITKNFKKTRSVIIANDENRLEDGPKVCVGGGGVWGILNKNGEGGIMNHPLVIKVR